MPTQDYAIPNPMGFHFVFQIIANVIGGIIHSKK